MKTRITLLIYPQAGQDVLVRKLLEDSGCHDVVAAGPSLIGSYAVKFNESDPKLHHLREGLLHADITRTEKREHIFSKTELQTAPLLWLTLRTAERGYPSPKYGTEYDLSYACPLCGTGAIQTSPLRLNPSEIPKKGDIFQLIDHEKLVYLELAHALKDAEISGLELRPAQSYKDKIDLPWVQLLAHVQLPPMAPTSTGVLREDPCPLCGRDGYFASAHEPMEIEYSSNLASVDALPDVVSTYECFGNSRLREPITDSYFALPLMLVKPKVYNIFQQQKVHGLDFLPVKVLES